jgi:hypothetical protein
MPDFIAHTDKLIAGEAKYTDTMTCECGCQMVFISLELGYSCPDPECILHMEDA